jgi:hypothetical protein
MATPVLTNEVAKMCSKTHIGHSGLMVTPLFDWEAFEHDEPLAVYDFTSNCSQQDGDIWEAEVFLLRTRS